MKIQRRRFLHVLGASALLWRGDGCKAQSKSVSIYTSVEQSIAEPIFQLFEQRTSIKVQALYEPEEAGGLGPVDRLIAEGDHPKADVLWSGDPMRALQLVRRGQVEPYRSSALAFIPRNMQGLDGAWTGVAARARVFLLNRTQVSALDRPDSLRDLVNPLWRGKAAIANPTRGTGLMHVAALYAVWGREQAQRFMDAVRANGIRVVGSNAEVGRLVASGEIAFGLTDSDDAYRVLNQGATVQVVYPDQKGLGTLLIPTTVVQLPSSAPPEPSRQLIDFLLSVEVEQRLAQLAGHIPLRFDVPTPPGVPGLGSLRFLEVNYRQVSEIIDQILPWLNHWAQP